MSAQTRNALCERYAETDTLMFAAHFPAPSVHRWVRHRNGFKIA
jgi:hypothetical protein